MMESVAEVLINRPSKHLNRTFSYRIPKGMEEARAGYRCIVTFARRKEEGIILSVHEEDLSRISYKILDIESLVDSFPWFTREMLDTALWISSYYMCTLIDALRLFYIDKKAVRTTVTYKPDWKKITEEKVSAISSLVDSSVEVLEEKYAVLLFGEKLPDYVKKGYLEKKETLAASHRVPLEKWIVPDRKLTEQERHKSRKQAELSDFLEAEGPSSLEKLKEKGFSTALIHAYLLHNYGHAVYHRKKTYSLIEEEGGGQSKQLTSEQKEAVKTICTAIDQEAYAGFLLKGVTGSGKTEVYLRAARHALEAGGSALILVPEIALTNQMTSYFASIFGDKVVFMHSNLSKGERYNNRMRISNGESPIVIGSRSAIFMPFKNLKLIVVDEEYDSSYKQGETPRYNGRDVAKVMAVIYHCPIVLGAATPSIATYYAACQGKIGLISMKERVFKTPLPKVYVCDLKETPPVDGSGLISAPLISLLHKTLAEKNKAILLLNRRGFATTLMCPSCGYVFKCPNCDVPLVYHKETGRLECHYCETVHPLPKECPRCKSRRILYLGAGTERIEEELPQLIPEARVRRFDLDSTRKKNSAREILDDFRNGKFDILFGTQMVAKGHDIPGVQTVGILSADSILNIPSYLAAEQTFNLITQCAGRAGRSRKQGEVILQTYNPSHYVIQAAARQDYESFYRQELKYREMLAFPPFTKLMKITCFHQEEKKAKEQADRIYSWLRKVIPQLKDQVRCTPPFSEPIKRVRNLYYISILIKGKSLSSLKSAMRGASLFQENDIIIDVDPL
ncbi:replication restart helicase PriA [Dialister sp.]|uniref:replication restart helicase PriA n=1 Tax=Dialister sp. TaxID=1955814 RepID=UPI003F035A43